MSGETQEQPGASADTSVQGIDLAQFTKDLIQDLADLRAGKISVQQARAASELARQAIRAMYLVVTAQRLIEDRAKPINQGGETE